MTTILRISSPITALYAIGDYFLAGSEDGVLRVYDAKTLKVAKALKLASEIASVATSPSSDKGKLPDVWVACGRQIVHCTMDSPKLILSVDDTTSITEASPEDDDVLNEICHDGSYVAFSLDSGRVGVLDTKTLDKRMVLTKHTNICGTVNFIPSREGELLSAGYDQILYHHNFFSGALLSSCQIPSRDNTGDISLSPPFIICTAVAPNGTVAGGTADGRIWLGFGGAKALTSQSKNKRTTESRFWAGLMKRESKCITVAEGPIVAMMFNEDLLTYSTMLGSVRQCSLLRNDQDVVSNKWMKSTSVIEKVNSLSVSERAVYVGGITKDGKGAIEIWDLAHLS